MQIHGFGPPEAPTVVLVHGAPDRSTGFRRVLPHLPELRLLTYDRRGYGESSEMTLAGSLVDHANDLIDLLADRPAVAVGHSFGGNVALLAAGMRPDLVRAVGVWETSMCWLSGWPAEHRHPEGEGDGCWRDVPARLGGHPVSETSSAIAATRSTRRWLQRDATLSSNSTTRPSRTADS